MELIKAIFTAMKEEADIIIKKYDLKEVKKLSNIIIYEGYREEDEKIVLVVSGIGKVQMAIGVSYIFENYDVFKVINIGIAGNIGWDDLKVGDVVLPNTFIQHDAYLPSKSEEFDYLKAPIFLDYAIGENLDLKKFGLIMNGICITGDQFIDDEEKMRTLKENFGECIVDMEAFSLLSVAREFDALEKCVVIKGISDGADADAKDAHMNNLEFAMNNSIIILDSIL
ncbi:5'-methylthioadenosine/S-adenosylhomocysteine nucleosidase [Candidatus Gracilibacteria bacterium]|nr:5'-methylthioadenosine/S-adenosylhomocysteine nucleosidase [Candidatus Gracilibacteria bacterium]NUJ99230.1 5'-methylthioadenosine/S-adenosylhomocysteine nucleosidase [Candidatus Gracilibacteria bacterium]